MARCLRGRRIRRSQRGREAQDNSEDQQCERYAREWPGYPNKWLTHVLPCPSRMEPEDSLCPQSLERHSRRLYLKVPPGARVRPLRFLRFLTFRAIGASDRRQFL